MSGPPDAGYLKDGLGLNTYFGSLYCCDPGAEATDFCQRDILMSRDLSCSQNAIVQGGVSV